VGQLFASIPPVPPNPRLTAEPPLPLDPIAPPELTLPADPADPADPTAPPEPAEPSAPPLEPALPSGGPTDVPPPSEQAERMATKQTKGPRQEPTGTSLPVRQAAFATTRIGRR
jgi:hypothetical protein